MRVVIGDRIYDSKEEPIMLILSDEEKDQIKKMKWDEHQYASSSTSIPELDILAWMNKYSDNKK